MNIGEKIKELRLYNSLTQYELSKKADISRSVLSAYENNIAIPTATVIAKIAVALDVSADYLLGIVDDFGARTAAPLHDGGTLSYSSEERELIEKYRELNAPGKKLVKTVIDTHLATLAENKQKKNL